MCFIKVSDLGFVELVSLFSMVQRGQNFSQILLFSTNDWLVAKESLKLKRFPKEDRRKEKTVNRRTETERTLKA